MSGVVLCSNHSLRKEKETIQSLSPSEVDEAHRSTSTYFSDGFNINLTENAPSIDSEGSDTVIPPVTEGMFNLIESEDFSI